MVYIEELLLLNFLIDYYLLYLTSLILKLNYKKYRMILSSIFGSISLICLFYVYSNLLLFILKIIISLIMITISFGITNIKEIIKRIIYYNILNYFLGGILYYFKINSFISYKYILLLIPIFMKIYKYFTFNIKNILNYRYKVTIYLNSGKVLYLNGYMDTGNNLIEPYNHKKVIIINKNIKENYYLVPYKTIDSYSLLKCFNPKKVYIDGLGERNDISIGIANKKLDGFDCLLNYKLMEEI